MKLADLATGSDWIVWIVFVILQFFLIFSDDFIKVSVIVQ